MLAVLRHRAYRRLFAAQVVALVGTGLATVALGLLAYDLAGADAGSVLGTALAIKMVAYVVIAPAVGAIADRLPRRALMVTADLVRAGIAVSLPFVGEVWQVYVLVFLLQSASAAFTPTFQAVIPDVLPEERDYTRALSMSRLAYDLESLFSPRSRPPCCPSSPTTGCSPAPSSVFSPRPRWWSRPPCPSGPPPPSRARAARTPGPRPVPASSSPSPGCGPYSP